MVRRLSLHGVFAVKQRTTFQGGWGVRPSPKSSFIGSAFPGIIINVLAHSVRNEYRFN